MSALTRRDLLAYASAAPITIFLADSSELAMAAGGLETVSVKTPSGRTVSAVLSVPAVVPAPAVVSVHGSLGSSDWYNSLAGEFAKAGFVGLAVDLYDGDITTDGTRGEQLKNAANANAAKTTETLVSWITWLKSDPRTNGKVGIVGFSFGAEWALRASIATPVAATVLYYGVIHPSTKELARLVSPVLGHFAEREHDPGRQRRSVEQLEREFEEAGRSIDVRWYDAQHAFANPEIPRYDKAAAEAAWAASIGFFRTNLR
jgi:carboxymethylenebutenolidase